ncbi:Protein argonaute-2 [Anthophora retusa]
MAKGKQKKKRDSNKSKTSDSQQQEQPADSQQQQEQPVDSQQQQQRPPDPQQQQQRPPGPQQQQQRPLGPQQQRPLGPQQQRPPGPQQQQQRPSGSQQQQEQPADSQQQQQRPPGPQQQQQRPPGPQQQQQRPPGPQQQQQRPPGPQQQQQRPPGPQQQQQRPPGPQQQQQRPPGPQQQQQRPPGPQQQQQRPPGPQQQQQRPPDPQQQQQRPPGPQQQQQRPPGPQQQQQRPPGPQQQQQRPPGPQQQQQRPSGPQQQQQRPPGPQQQQQRPPGPQQQQQRPPGPQQQQQRPPDPQQQQQRPPGPQQQQQRPPGPQQQQQRPSGSQQQQQRPPGPQKQQPWGAPIQQQQKSPPGPQQQQQRPSGSQQQQEQPADSQQQQQRPPGPQQQQQRPPGPQQQQQRPPGPQQQQQQQRPPGPQQQQQRPSGSQQQQQRPPGPQQQQPWGAPIQQQQKSPFDSPQELEQQVVKHGTRYIMPRNLHQMYLDQIPSKRSLTGGKAGRPITVETNMLKMILNSNFESSIVHYDVVITPDKPKFLLRPIFEEFRKKHFPKRFPAFDGKKNAFSAKELPFGDTSVEDEIKLYDSEFCKERTFKIYLKKAGDIDLSWLRNVQFGFRIEGKGEEKGLQALNVIFHHAVSDRYVSIHRSLFHPPTPGHIVSLTNGLDLWYGVFQSVVIGSRPYLNIDVVHKGFPTEQSVIELMKQLCGNVQNVTPRDVERNHMKINKFLKGLKIQYEIPGQTQTKRTYRVNGLVECPRNNEFRLEDKSLCTVEQYFAQTKKYKIQYPDLPCLWVGSQNNKIYLPAELCKIVAGQVTHKQMDESQTRTLIRYASTDTVKRKEKIMNCFSKMNLNSQPSLTNEFRLSVQTDFEKVPARVLEPPQLQYNDREVRVFKGVWKAEKFLKPSTLPENLWTILNLDRTVYDTALYKLHDELQKAGRRQNMTIGNALKPFANLSTRGNTNEIMKYFREKKEQGVQLIVVIIEGRDNTVYGVIKKISELDIPNGMVTQCIKSETIIRRLSDSTITNILLKINSKLNGINHTFAPSYRPRCLQKPCMIVGADVTHPSPDSMNIPSIAAVAASHDPNAFKYNIEMRLQSPREEMIQDMEAIVVNQLMFFYKHTGYKPLQLIFYRDGVSEGHLTQVMHFEMTAIRKAVERLYKSEADKISLTYFVVQKRHHTRFFPTDKRNSDDRNFNVQAGTVVDTEITHPTHIDFYLVSHASIQGTARPTKYRCICNEANMSEDEIEHLTYYLCHMFARCTRSVSYPAPTYYAHVAACRARSLIQNVPLNLNNLEEEQRRKLTLTINKTSPMFFV